MSISTVISEKEAEGIRIQERLNSIGAYISNKILEIYGLDQIVYVPVGTKEYRVALNRYGKEIEIDTIEISWVELYVGNMTIRFDGNIHIPSKTLFICIHP